MTTNTTTTREDKPMTTTTVPDYIPMLRKGTGRTPKEGGCLVQVAGWLRDGHSWSDKADCVHPMLRAAGIYVNDRVSDDDRHRLAPSAARLSDSADAVDDTQQERLIAALGAWAARSVRGLASGVAVHERINYTLTTWDYTRRPLQSIDTVTLYVADAVRNASDPATAPDAVIAAAHAIKHSRGDLVAWFEALLDEFDRLTGHTSQPMTEEQGRAVSAAMEKVGALV